MWTSVSKNIQRGSVKFVINGSSLVRVSSERWKGLFIDNKILVIPTHFNDSYYVGTEPVVVVLSPTRKLPTEPYSESGTPTEVRATRGFFCPFKEISFQLVFE